jgi:hypothetical protein
MTDEVREGKLDKGGVNECPETPRPEPPVGQGGIPDECPTSEEPKKIRTPREVVCVWCGYRPIDYMDGMVHLMKHFPQSRRERLGMGFRSEHWEDKDGNLTGGCSYGIGFTISWQNGPLGRGEDRKVPNGAFVEDVLDAARDRLDHYQSGGLACEENAEAIEHLIAAGDALRRRTRGREARGVEGTNEA